MVQLASPVSAIAAEIRSRLTDLLREEGFGSIDASSEVTGRDFLLKIWKMMFSVPLGIAVIHGDMPRRTYANIFYELGVMQAYGKETLVVRTEDAQVPSDFIRTEYVVYDRDFDANITKYLESVGKQAEYYLKVSDQLENNPLLAIDYLRRSYLISGDESCRAKAQSHFNTASLEGRAKNSVEMLLVNF
jgi:hypothetical protein